MTNPDKTVTINFVKFESTTYNFRRPVEVEIRFKVETLSWWCESELLPFYAYGDSAKNARKTFDMLFAANWAKIACAPDYQPLPPASAALKKTMLDLVALVERHGTDG